MISIGKDGIYVEVFAGACIGTVIEESLKLARKERKNVHFMFNDIHMAVDPRDSVDYIREQYNSKITQK